MKILVTAFTLVFALSGACYAADASGQETEKIEGIVHDYLMENPEVIMKALENYKDKQEAQYKQAQKENLQKHLDYLYGKDRPDTGNPDGDVTVVEFFDYNCGYCRRALNDIIAVMETDKNVRFVLLDLPILSPASELAAKWSLAAKEQGKYFEFHKVLMNRGGLKSEKILEKVAEEVGLDINKIRDDIKSEKIERELNKNREIARDLGLSGTPAFIIGENVSRGYIGTVAMKEEIRKAREDK